MRVVVLANKWWECEAMLAAMLNSSAFPANLVIDNTTIITAPWCGTLSSPRSQKTDQYHAENRATFTYNANNNTSSLWKFGAFQTCLKVAILRAASASRRLLT